MHMDCEPVLRHEHKHMFSLSKGPRKRYSSMAWGINCIKYGAGLGLGIRSMQLWISIDGQCNRSGRQTSSSSRDSHSNKRRALRFGSEKVLLLIYVVWFGSSFNVRQCYIPFGAKTLLTTCGVAWVDPRVLSRTFNMDCLHHWLSHMRAGTHNAVDPAELGQQWVIFN